MIPQEILKEWEDSDFSVAELEKFGVCDCGKDIALYEYAGFRYCPDCWEKGFPTC